MSVKCTIQMKDKLPPVKGSATGSERNRTGTCPTCHTPGVMLSIIGGYIRAHTTASTPIPENNPQPATLTETPGKKTGKTLTEHRADMTDSGQHIGDPNTADKRRGHAIDGALNRGTIKIPVTTPPANGRGKGRTKLEDAPATEANVRAALAYWTAKRVRVDDKGRPLSPSAHKHRLDMIAEMHTRLDGMYQAPTTYTATTTDQAVTHRGPTLVPGRDGTPRTRSPKLPFTQPTDTRRNGDVRKRTTIDEPRGHDRPDPKIINVPQPPTPLTRSQKRRNRRKRTHTRYVTNLLNHTNP